jgi:hypothetical protein
MLKDISLFTSQPKTKFNDELFLNLDLSFVPSQNSNWNNGKNNRGCTKYITIPDDYRLSIHRGSIAFKSIYSLRSEAEHYNSRFKQFVCERVFFRNKISEKNLNSIAHISLLAITISAVVTKNLFLITQ